VSKHIIEPVHPVLGSAIAINKNVISVDTTIPANYSGCSTGPITVADGVTVTVPDGSVGKII